jgi:hypothetical protein
MHLTAIDVLLDPDEIMVRAAKAANARLRADYPDGFALDADHAPHITVVQCFVRTAGLDQIGIALGEVFGRVDLPALELEASGYYYLPWQSLGVGGITIAPTRALLDLQEAVVLAVAPFSEPEAGPDAFVGAPDTPSIVATAEYVAGFASTQTGSNYNPHVTVGLGAARALDAIIAEPFERFGFRAERAAVYQLGDFGTAQRLLWSSA